VICQTTWAGQPKMIYTFTMCVCQFLLPLLAVIVIYVCIYLKLKKRPKVGVLMFLIYGYAADFIFLTLYVMHKKFCVQSYESTKRWSIFSTFDARLPLIPNPLSFADLLMNEKMSRIN
jgi:chromate transport protein ChrA